MKRNDLNGERKKIDSTPKKEEISEIQVLRSMII